VSPRGGGAELGGLNRWPGRRMIGGCGDGRAGVKNMPCAWCGAVHEDALGLGTCVLLRIEGLGKARAHLGLWLEFRAAMALHLQEIDEAIEGRAAAEESPAELQAFRRTAVAYLDTVDKEIAARFPGAPGPG
jgi:hypothetical protein